jgi:1,4-alpha-glucan branching enzyme
MHFETCLFEAMGNSQSVDLCKTQVPKINDLFNEDGYLKPYECEIRRRYGVFESFLKKFENSGESLDQFSKSYETYGINKDSDNNICVLEWAPAADNIYLRGDFSRSFSEAFNLFQYTIS